MRKPRLREQAAAFKMLFRFPARLSTTLLHHPLRKNNQAQPALRTNKPPRLGGGDGPPIVLKHNGASKAGGAMSSRLLLTGVLASPAMRRKRKADGVIFAVAKVRDTDRGEDRLWTAFANDATTIERLEEMRVGEPIGLTGPFSIAIAGPERLEYRISVEALVDTKRRRKPKGKICQEERTEFGRGRPSAERIAGGRAER